MILDTCYATASNLLDSWYNGLSGLNSTVGSATLSANQSLRDAAKTADPTSDMTDYLKSVASADVDHSVALAQNLGNYQLGWRGEAGQAPGQNAELISAQIPTISKVGGARVAYFQALGNTGIDYTDTVLDALGGFNTTTGGASDTYASALDNAGKSYGDTMLTLEEVYSRAMFSAEKTRTLALFGAERSSANAVASAAVSSAHSRASATEAKSTQAKSVISGLVAQAGSDTFHTACSSAATQLNTIKNTPLNITTTTVDPSILTDAKTTANVAYVGASLWASVSYAIGAMASQTVYATDATTAGDSLLSNVEQASNDMIATESVAWQAIDGKSLSLYKRYTAAVAQLNSNPLFDAVAYINGGNTNGNIQPCGLFEESEDEFSPPNYRTVGPYMPIGQDLRDLVYADYMTIPADVGCSIITGLHDAGDGVRGFTDKSAFEIRKFGYNSNRYLGYNMLSTGTSMYLAYASNILESLGYMAGGIVDAPGSVQDGMIDIGTSYQLTGQYGFGVGAARQVGLLAFTEGIYGVDVASGQKVNLLDKWGEGSGRFGAAAGTLAAGGGMLQKLTPTVGRSAPLGSNPYGVSQEFVGIDGKLIYPTGPTKDGFLLGIRGKRTLQVGEIIDRYGRPSGKFASPDGTPFPRRSLPPNMEGAEYHRYRVLRPIEKVGEGLAAPWFGQPGGGKQYFLPKSIEDLLGKYLEVIE